MLELTLKVPPDDFDEDLFAGAISKFVDVVGDVEDVRVHVTVDFTGKVREVVADAAYGAAYQQNRDFAFAVAKTIAQLDGSTDLILDPSLFRVGASAEQANRTLEHEGLHVAVNRRGESLNDLRLRRGIDPSRADGTFIAMAGVAAEEYRIERALYVPDAEPGVDGPCASFGDLTMRFDAAVRKASNSYQLDRDVGVICVAILDAFHAVATYTGYVAAEVAATEDAAVIRVSRGVEQRVLGPVWSDVVRALRLIPSALAVTPRAELDALADDVAAKLELWLEEIGFRFVDTDVEGQRFFGVLNPEVWVA